MPIDDINGTFPVLPTTLQGRTQTSVPLATSPLNIVKNPVAVATAATQNLTPVQQATLLGSEALQILNLEPTSPTEPLLATGTTSGITAVTESQGLSPAQQAALAVNETVQTAIEPQNLTPAQQAALTANQATQTLATPLTPAEAPITAATVGIGEQTLAPGPVETAVASGTATGGMMTSACHDRGHGCAYHYHQGNNGCPRSTDPRPVSNSPTDSVSKCARGLRGKKSPPTPGSTANKKRSPPAAAHRQGAPR